MKALMTVKESDLAKLKHNLAVGKHIKLEEAFILNHRSNNDYNQHIKTLICLAKH